MLPGLEFRPEAQAPALVSLPCLPDRRSRLPARTREGKLVAVNPADIDTDSVHSDELPARWFSQILTVWFVAFLAAFLLLCTTVTGVGAAALAACLLTIFVGGYFFGSQLTLPWICVAWGVAGIPVFIAMSYVAVLTDNRASLPHFAVAIMLL